MSSFNHFTCNARATVAEWIGKLAQLRDRASLSRASAYDDAPGLSDLDWQPRPSSPRAASSLGAWLNALDWDVVRGEVDRESRAHILIAGAVGVGKTTLLHRLIGLPSPGDVGGAETASAQRSATPETTGYIPADADEDASGVRVESLGLFDLLDVHPGFTPRGQDPGSLVVAQALDAADLVIWLLDATAGLRGFEREWICRMRSAGRPLLIAANKMDAVSDPAAPQALSRALACPVVGCSARDGSNIVEELLPRIADISPQLNTALGREVPAWRAHAARRVTERAAILSGLVGIEPVPVVDIPFQALIQLRLVMRLAAIYGEPQADRYSRELLATLAGSAVLRYAGQQITKAVPLVGWIASSALAAGGTWAIGKAAEAYFAHGRKLGRGRRREAEVS
ncbi:MAG: DUF697 domain-containing protein [Anaerolineae bacterium]|nr:DUF697 domain-containing protein [Candidatus Roseilinea sp.]MDW8449263.1 DUF697 domain-containing protein [Anaerolineae bacterium]